MTKTTISSKGQIVIPKHFRDRYGLKRGTVLELTELDEEGGLVINKPLATEPISWVDWIKKARGLHKEIWAGVDPVQYTHDLWDEPKSR